jgi:hypothetical protein
MSLEEMPDPPPPPEVPRHVRFHRYQWVGLTLLAVLPLLAIAGVFGETWRVESASGAGLEVSTRYPDRYRYKQLTSVEVWLTNTSAAVLDTVTVALDTALANRFSTVRALPAFADPYETEVTNVAPGETRLVVIELQSERYGRHEGDLVVRGPPTLPDTLVLPLSILIFP